MIRVTCLIWIIKYYQEESETRRISITFEGGHKIDVLKNNTLIYEHKTGPYEGQKKDLLYFDFWKQI